MHKEHPEVLFIGTLIAAILASVFFLNGSITGYVTQTMHCDSNGECNNFCNSDYDCEDVGKICCEISGRGICYLEDSCVTRYNLFKDSNLDFVEDNPIENEGKTRAITGITFFSIMTFLVIIIAVIFIYHSQHLYPKKTKKKSTKKKSRKK